MTCPAATENASDEYLEEETRSHIRTVMEVEKAVLLGFNASMLQEKSPKKWMLPLDLLATPDKRTDLTKKIMHSFGKPVKSRNFPAYEELMPPRTDITDNKNTVLVRIYETQACHSYHKTPSGLMVASIPTLLQFFLSTLYAPKEFLESKPEQRFLCTAEHLVNLANESKHKYKILTPLTCLGTQKDLVTMRVETADLYNKLKEDKNSREFLELFFNYTPTDLTKTQRQKVRKSLKKTLKTRRP
jgi:hypothetical protein